MFIYVPWNKEGNKEQTWIVDTDSHRWVRLTVTVCILFCSRWECVWAHYRGGSLSGDSVVKTGFCQKDEQQRHLNKLLNSDFHGKVESIQTCLKNFLPPISNGTSSLFFQLGAFHFLRPYLDIFKAPGSPCHELTYSDNSTSMRIWLGRKESQWEGILPVSLHRWHCQQHHYLSSSSSTPSVTHYEMWNKRKLMRCSIAPWKTEKHSKKISKKSLNCTYFYFPSIYIVRDAPKPVASTPNFFLHLRKERRSYILPTRRHLRPFDLPPPLMKRWYRPRKSSVDERNRFTPPSTWCCTSQRRGSVKILFHTDSIILNTNNPPYTNRIF